MPEDTAVEFVIEGVTLGGRKFRPGDWAERLCGVLAAFGNDHRMRYSPYVHPVAVHGTVCVCHAVPPPDSRAANGVQGAEFGAGKDADTRRCR